MGRKRIFCQVAEAGWRSVHELALHEANGVLTAIFCHFRPQEHACQARNSWCKRRQATHGPLTLLSSTSALHGAYISPIVLPSITGSPHFSSQLCLNVGCSGRSLAFRSNPLQLIRLAQWQPLYGSSGHDACIIIAPPRHTSHDHFDSRITRIA